MASPRPRPGILEIQPYVGGKAEAKGAARTIKLSANESALGPSPKAIDAIEAALADSHRYPDGGADRLRAAIGRRFELDPERIVCGSGSDELIHLLIAAYAGPGEEVLYSAHGFLMYRLNALAAGATPVAAPETGLRTDIDALLARVTSRTRLVFIANPNNPTGSYITADELSRLHAGLPEDVVLVIDAAYAEYAHRDDYTTGRELIDRAENVVMTRTFSKMFGLAALRLGWLYAPPGIVDVLNRVRGPFNVNSLAQTAGIAALEDLDHQERSIAHNDHWLPRMTQAISGLGLSVHPSIANFVLIEFPADGAKTASAASTWLEKDGITARPMTAYGLPHCLRLSIGQAEDNKAAIDSLEGFMTS
ncbi:MAG: histidinol-phosphate transaminase [Alphaproteobacteria bacterium]|nr:histidinol-phosphate transaminase [Alphaproteobacteria bacterium]